MRNLSMKKFGTPIAAGPGMASDVVGFCRVGTPWSLRRFVRPGLSARAGFLAFVESVRLADGLARRLALDGFAGGP